METKAFQGKTKLNRPYQYLIAARLNLAKDNKMTVKPNEIKYYTNIDVQRAKDDCDGVCQAKVTEIRTKQESTDTLERLSGMKTRCDTQVHTELQFLYGKDYRASLSEGGIFLIYSYYIPCAGLAKCSLGECAGDLAYGLVDIRMNSKKPVYFVIMYSDAFKRQMASTNECVSKLYHINAGIPMLKCTRNGDAKQCEVKVGGEFRYTYAIQCPVFHRVPRINQAAQKKNKEADVFIICLAMGEFLQKAQGQSSQSRTSLSSEQLYQQDANNAKIIASWLAKLKNPKTNVQQNIQGVTDVKNLIQRHVKVSAVFDIVGRCNSYIDCLPGLTQGPPTLANLGDDLSCSVQDALCKTYSKSLFVGEKVPEVCKSNTAKRRCVNRGGN